MTCEMSKGKLLPLVIAGVVSTALMAGQAASAMQISATAPGDDAQLNGLADGTSNNSNNNPNNFTSANSSGASAAAGFFTEFSSNSAEDVEFVFQLPTLATGQVVTSATFSIGTTSNSGGINYGLDLYALAPRTTPYPQAGDFYVGAADTQNTLIQANFVPASSSTSATYTTSTAGSTTLGAYIAGLYGTNPSVAGQYLFLRVNPDTTEGATTSLFTTQTFAIAQDAGSGITAPLPALTLTTVGGVPTPEPASLGIMGLGIAGLFLMAKRRAGPARCR